MARTPTIFVASASLAACAFRSALLLTLLPRLRLP